LSFRANGNRDGSGTATAFIEMAKYLLREVVFRKPDKIKTDAEMAKTGYERWVAQP